MASSKRISERSAKHEILKAYESVSEEATRHQKTLDGLTEEFSALQKEHARLKEKTAFIEGLRQKLTALNERMDLITKISQEVQSLDLDRILGVCISKVPFLLNAKYTSVYLFDREQNRLVLSSCTHGRSLRKSIPLDEAGSMMSVALKRKEPLVIEDMEAFAERQETELKRPYAEQYGTQSCVVAPLFAGDQVVGVLTFADRNDGKPFDASTDLQPVRALAGILAASIKNLQLFDEVRKQSTLDGLTGLLNHTAVNDTLRREIERSKRYKERVCFALLDVDRFTQHNANLGHGGGDAILSLVARQIAKHIRTVDMAGRYGADEFAIIFPETTVEGAQKVTRRVMDEVKVQDFVFRDVPYRITLSGGIAALSEDERVRDFVGRTETALKTSRAEGREDGITVAEAPGS